MPDDHSEVVPLLPIPNRKVKRLCADDSAGSRVKVGHCQANIEATARTGNSSGVLLLGRRKWPGNPRRNSAEIRVRTGAGAPYSKRPRQSAFERSKQR